MGHARQGLTLLAFVFGGIYEAITRARLFEEEGIGRSLAKWFGSFLIGGLWGLVVMVSMVGADWVIMYPDYAAEACGETAAHHF